MLLQVAQSRESAVAELTGVRRGGVVPVGVDADVGIDFGLRREAGGRWGRAGRRCLPAAPRVCSTILAVPGRASGPERFCESEKVASFTGRSIGQRVCSV